MGLLHTVRFKDQAWRWREAAILDAATTTLAVKGFDLMTMDDVAIAVGISKPSLYKHFKSKDELVGAALIRRVDDALERLDQMPAELPPVDRLRNLLEWALRVRLDGGLPLMPATSAQVRDMLMRNSRYMVRVRKLSAALEAIVEAGKARGQLRAELPTDLILFSYYARTCDPTVDYLRLYANLEDRTILAHLVEVFFRGICCAAVCTPTDPTDPTKSSL